MQWKPILPEKIFLRPPPGCSAQTGWDGICWPEPLQDCPISIRIGVLTAGVSAAAALLLGIAAATLGRKADAVISWCIDLVMGIPHILLVMLISIACGRGFAGVTAGIALSHWPSLAV